MITRAERNDPHRVHPKKRERARRLRNLEHPVDCSVPLGTPLLEDGDIFTTNQTGDMVFRAVVQRQIG